MEEGKTVEVVYGRFQGTRSVVSSLLPVPSEHPCKIPRPDLPRVMWRNTSPLVLNHCSVMG